MQAAVASQLFGREVRGTAAKTRLQRGRRLAHAFIHAEMVPRPPAFFQLPTHTRRRLI